MAIVNGEILGGIFIGKSELIEINTYTANTLFTHIYQCFTVTCFYGGFVSTFECMWGHFRAAFGAAVAVDRGEADPWAAGEAGPSESNAGYIPGWCSQVQGKYAARC